jgi:hypothetical protein
MGLIEGMWEGIGEEISLLEGDVIEKTPLKLFVNIKKVSCNSYIVKTQYYIINGPLQFEETYLILRNEDQDEFISEDASGSGINFYKFEKGFHFFGLNKLTYKYNINGNSEIGTSNGEFILYRSYHY